MVLDAYHSTSTLNVTRYTFGLDPRLCKTTINTKKEKGLLPVARGQDTAAPGPFFEPSVLIFPFGHAFILLVTHAYYSKSLTLITVYIYTNKRKTSTKRYPSISERPRSQD